MQERIRQQLEFILEVDKVKQIFRQSFVTDGSRYENDAEHSWHMAIMAVLLAEHVDVPVDVLRVIKMVLMHDLVEIDAGDTYCYDCKAKENQAEREAKAADRIFALLPPDQGKEFRQLWEEFEQARTPEARFAAALDRLQPLLLHYKTEGRSWHMHGITSAKVLERNKRTREISQTLGECVDELIRDAVRSGYLPE